jgi:hypothetical protein
VEKSFAHFGGAYNLALALMKGLGRNLFFCAAILTSVALSDNKASAASILTKDVLTLSITFHTQEIDNFKSGKRYKIVETTLNTIDVLNALAKDLGVTNNGVLGFPKGSFLWLSGDKITVVSGSDQVGAWDVSDYLQYSLASDVVLGRGTIPGAIPIGAGPQDYLSTISLVHVHFEDADYVAHFTGFANSQPATLRSPLSISNTSISPASGSGMIDGKPALITAEANVESQPLTPLGPITIDPGRGPIFPASSGR